jgi:hypothetical protein
LNRITWWLQKFLSKLSFEFLTLVIRGPNGELIGLDGKPINNILSNDKPVETVVPKVQASTHSSPPKKPVEEPVERRERKPIERTKPKEYAEPERKYRDEKPKEKEPERVISKMNMSEEMGLIIMILYALFFPIDKFNTLAIKLLHLSINIFGRFRVLTNIFFFHCINLSAKKRLSFTWFMFFRWSHNRSEP